MCGRFEETQRLRGEWPRKKKPIPNNQPLTSLKAINLFNWEFSLNNLAVNDQVSVFNETIMNIMPNIVPSKLITCDDRDPPWMNCYIKIRFDPIVLNFYVWKFMKPLNSIYSQSQVSTKIAKIMWLTYQHQRVTDHG